MFGIRLCAYLGAYETLALKEAVGELTFRAHACRTAWCRPVRPSTSNTPTSVPPTPAASPPVSLHARPPPMLSPFFSLPAKGQNNRESMHTLRPYALLYGKVQARTLGLGKESKGSSNIEFSRITIENDMTGAEVMGEGVTPQDTRDRQTDKKLDALESGN